MNTSSSRAPVAMSKRRRPAPLRRVAFVASVALLLLVPIAYFLLGYIPHERADATATIRARLLALADDRAVAIGRWVDERFQDADTVASHPTVARLLVRNAGPHSSEMTSEAERLLVQEALDAAVRGQGLDGAAILDRDGNVVAAAGAADLGAESSRSVGVDAMRERRNTTRFIGGADAGPEVVFAVPATLTSPDPAAKPAVVGAVVVNASPSEFLYPLLLREPVPTVTGEVRLIRREGAYITYLSPLRHRPDPPLTYRRPFEAAAESGAPSAAVVEGREEFRSGVDYRGVAVFSTGRLIAHTDWAVVAKIDQDEALAPFRTDVRAVAAMIGAFSGVVATGAFLLQRRRRRRYEEVVADATARVAAVVDQARDAVLLLDEGLKIVEANRAAEQMYGRPVAEIVGRSLRDLRAPETLDALSGQIEAARLPEGTVFETLHQRANGERFPVEVGTRLVEYGGQSLYLDIVRDVTERVDAEGALRASEERFERFMAHAPELAYIKDENARCLFANSPFATLLGVDPVAIVGKTNEEIFGPEIGAQFSADDLAVLRGGRPIEREETFIGPDGVTRHFVTHKFPIPRPGKAPLLGGFSLDVTESKRAQEQISRLAAAVQQAAETVVITDTAGRILYVNPAFSHITGYSAEEAIGKNPRLLKSGEHDAAFYRRLWDTILRGEIWHDRIINRRKDGTLYEEDASISPVRDASGEIVNFVAVKRDVTQEVAMETRLRQSQKMEAVGNLAGGVAHDFNNLLQAMLSHTQLVDHWKRDPARVVENVAELEQQIRRAGALVRQLLLFSHREAARPEALDLNEVVIMAAGFLRRLVRENILFQVEPCDESLVVKADHGQLDQVLMNLVVNASDAMSEGGTLTIRTGTGGEASAWIEVADTGHGIPAGIRDRIFEPFFTTKGIGRGSGLGLSVVHGIVDQLGGRVDVVSREGAGARFRVSVPRASSLEVRRPVSGDERPVPESGNGERILVVEDEPGAREGLVEILLSLGYQVRACVSGEEALDLPDAGGYDVLLTDLMLPGISGHEVARRLRERWPGLRVILMSGYAEDETVRRAIAGGAVRFLQKPFDIPALARELRGVLAPVQA